MWSQEQCWDFPGGSRLHLPKQEVPVRSLAGELRSHRLCGQKKQKKQNRKQKQYYNKFYKDFFKKVYIEKNLFKKFKRRGVLFS